MEKCLYLHKNKLYIRFISNEKQYPVDMTKKDNNIILLPIKNIEEHIEFLYELLNARKHNISHEKIPSFNEHRLFVDNHPYREWYLIEENNKFVGSLYIANNNAIGINILSNSKSIIKKSIEWVSINKNPLPGIKSLRSNYFHINVSPENKVLIKALNDMKAPPVEVTYLIK